MNGAILLILGLSWFVLAYFVYGRFLARLFGVDDKRETPAHSRDDGIDYVPTRWPVLFGHHFASIAGAGPIVGPVLALFLGWLPAVLWILLGCVFIGAVHDFGALFISVRNDGRSIGYIIEKKLGYFGRQVFLVFTWCALILVVAVFALFTARTFVGVPATATASLLFIVMAPVFGWLVYRRGMSIMTGSLIFVPLMFVFVWFGTLVPLDLTRWLSAASAEHAWIVILLIYVSLASVAPVWLLLQPRDYLNSFLLYAMIAAGLTGIFFTAPVFNMPAFTGWWTENHVGREHGLFPILYITIACGACSGFHALVASGTTAKQLDNERHILKIGYGAMLVEGLLALMAIISVAVLSKGEYFAKLNATSPVSAFAGGLAGLTAALGLPEKLGATFISLAVSAFMLTTLDTATRLARFTWQEMFMPKKDVSAGGGSGGIKFSTNAVTATLIAVSAAAAVAFSGGSGIIWPVFGASNQLLAALTLLVLAVYLVRRRKNAVAVILPMIFMIIMSCWALVVLIGDSWGRARSITVVSVFLLLMALTLTVLGAGALKGARGVPPAGE